MSPTAKANSNNNEVKSKPSPEECEPDKKKDTQNSPPEESKKLPPRVPDKFFIVDSKKLPPKKKKRSSEPNPKLTKQKLARAVDLCTRSLPLSIDVRFHITHVSSRYSGIIGAAAQIQEDTRDLLAKLTPEQLQDPETRRLSNRIQAVTRSLDKDSTEAHTHTEFAEETISELEQILVHRNKVVEDATDNLFNFGEVTSQEQAPVCYDCFDNQIFIGDTVLATLPDYGLTEAIVVQLESDNFVHITPRRSGRTFCWCGIRVELVPETFQQN